MIIEYRVDLIVNPYHQVKEVDFHEPIVLPFNTDTGANEESTKAG